MLIEDSINGLLFILVGILGALGHYFKKRYVDDSIDISLWKYLTGNFKYTLGALLSLIGSELTLSITLGSIWTLSALVNAFTLGYTCDSAINRAPER